MKIKDNNLKNLEVQTKKKLNKKKERVNKGWILIIFIVSFSLSIFMSFICSIATSNVNTVIASILTFIFIFIGILFDIIGVAVTSSSEKVFHSMNSRKVYGAKLAVKFKKNEEKVSSFCCDVIGDVCGVMSGAMGASLAASIISNTNFNAVVVSLLVTGFIASLTITGKAIGKSFAVNESNIILYEFTKAVSVFYKK